MRYVRFNFIDETFGEEVECLLIWDDEEFIIVTLDEEEIKIVNDKIRMYKKWNLKMYKIIQN